MKDSLSKKEEKLVKAEIKRLDKKLEEMQRRHRWSPDEMLLMEAEANLDAPYYDSLTLNELLNS